MVAKRSIFFLMLIIPSIIYFFFIYRFGVNVLTGDNPTLLPIIRHFYLGNLTFSEIWAPLFGHRILIPNLLFIINAEFFHLNMKLSMYVGWAFLTGSFIFLAQIYRKRLSGSLYPLIPVSMLMFTLAQSESTLMGDQIGWYFILFCLMGVCLLLEESEKKSQFWIAIILCICASFSSFQGLSLWVAGFIYIFFNNFKVYQKIIWIFFSFVVTFMYLHGLGGGTRDGLTYTLSHPLYSIEFLFLSISSFFPLGQAINHFVAISQNQDLLIQGVVGFSLLLLGLYALVQAFMRVGKEKIFLAPLAIFCTTLLNFAALVGGRTMLGLDHALSSHYVAFTMLFPISIYLMLFYAREKDNHIKYRILLATLFPFIILQSLITYYYGWAYGEESSVFFINQARVIANYSSANVQNNLPLEISIYSFMNPDNFDKNASFMEKYKLSVFGSSKLSLYRSEGFPPFVLPVEKLLPIPPNVQTYFQQNPPACTAWYVVSYLYNTRWDLQAAFPLTSKSSIPLLLNWELNADGLHLIMHPYQKMLLQIKKLIEKDPGEDHNKPPDTSICKQVPQ